MRQRIVILVTVDHGEAIRGKRVLMMEDGPPITHNGAAEIVDPQPYITGALAATFVHYPQIDPAQIADLAATIAAVPADLVLVATPIVRAG